MPQADLTYSADLNFDSAQALRLIEEVIKSCDATSGNCKGRAYKLEVTYPTQVLLRLAVLEKPHRDSKFMQTLTQTLHEALIPLLPAGCVLSVELRFLSPYYQSTAI